MSLYIPSYFLHVDIIVPEGNRDAFQKQMANFLRLDGFRRLDPANQWSLVLALRTPDPFATQLLEAVGGAHEDGIEKQGGRVRDVLERGNKGTSRQVYRYVHLWNIPDTNDLNVAAIMNACADDPVYMALDALVAREIQDLVVQIEWPSADVATNAPTPGNGEFVRVRRQFKSKDLGAYVYNVPSLLPALARAGWTSFGHYESATGLLNTFTEFWHTNRSARNSHLLETMSNAFGPPPENPKAPTNDTQAASIIWNKIKDLDPYEKRERLIQYLPAVNQISALQ
jgi:hypothetical protein